ncbi:MAG: CoA-binding protein [Bacteroidales bacterium]|nr:CoA-binding protein [Bacteroidales bacterium]
MAQKNQKSNLESVKSFMYQKHVAIVGISRKSQKFGNTIFKELNKKDYHLYPIHPELHEFEGVKCYRDIATLPEEVTAVIVCTQPEKVLPIVKETHAKKIRHIWLQQGAQSDEAAEYATENGLNLVQRECILMFAEPVGSIHKFHRFLNKFFGAYPK